MRNFRSYGEFELHDLGDLSIFVGPNASGKTNAVEAIQLLTALSSFRNSTGAQLVRNGEAFSCASIDITDGNRQLEVALSIQQDVDTNTPGSSHATHTTLAKTTRQYTLNGKRRPTKEIRGILPSVTFTPDDLNLAKGSDRHRRRELDTLGAQLNANYYQLVRDFEKVLRHKNHLLKEGAAPGLIEAQNEVFQKVADQLSNYREALFERLIPHVAAHYEDISGGREKLTAEYVRSNTATIAEELARGRSLWGPHLDKLHFYIDELDVQSFASQGQQRSIVLAMKLAEAEVIEEMLDQLPVLLLDDVMSELDGERREALVKSLLQGKQTFITTANIDYFDPEMLSYARIVRL